MTDSSVDVRLATPIHLALHWVHFAVRPQTTDANAAGDLCVCVQLGGVGAVGVGVGVGAAVLGNVSVAPSTPSTMRDPQRVPRPLLRATARKMPRGETSVLYKFYPFPPATEPPHVPPWISWTEFGEQKLLRR